MPRIATRILIAIASILCLAGTALAEPTPGDTVLLGPFTGVGAQLHPDNLLPIPVKYDGTDLGFSYEHQGQLHFLFGDTTISPTGDRVEQATGALHDDMFATIDLADWPDPALITSLNMPLLRLGQDPGTDQISGINPGAVMDDLKTPEAGWSNGEREFAILLLTKPQGCQSDAQCDAGLSCDTGIGYLGAPYYQEAELTLGCTEGRPGCVADTMVDAAGAPIAGTGLCVDRSSSTWSDTEAGRVASVVMKQRISLRSQSNPKEYQGLDDWMTVKFVNATVRAVERFDPAKGTESAVIDYLPATGTDARQRVLVWGRPGFIGVGSKGRSMALYFAYADMPQAPEFNWQLHYYTGIDETGVPQFSLAEHETVPVDLDSTQAGVQTAEVVDLVQHMSAVWVEHLKKWIMFYGGGIDITPVPAMGLVRCGILEVFVPNDCEQVNMGNGSIYMRSADNPWGPWTPPVEVIAGGDPQVPGSGQYGIGGALANRFCTQPGCAPHGQIDFLNPEGYGWFYGANIIEQWIRPAGAGVDVLWNASTWDPYRVVLLRTRINP